MVCYVSFVLLSVLFLTEPSSGQRLAVTPSRQDGVLLYDYSKVLDYSLLFYEAQRSGVLPRDNRVPWRGDSCLQCEYKGANLSGGYYTSGRTPKFTFPNAAALTVLAWGVIQHKQAYQQAGLLDRMLECVAWGADYLVRCHVGEELVALVGDLSEFQRQKWNRPEDLQGPSPVFAISPEKPGSDLAGEVAAALAASSMVVREFDPSRADEYVRHSEQLLEFAISKRGVYSDSVTQVAAYYKSWGGYDDELVWASVWLHKATNKAEYLETAERFYREFNFVDRQKDEFSWDDKTAGVKVLLYGMSEKYRSDATWFCDLARDSARSSTNGLFNVKPLMALRYASSAAFVCLELGELLKDDKSAQYPENPYLGFALQQINVALGASGRSYLVGFGSNWPQFIHHVGSFCPTRPSVCDRSSFFSPAPNPHVLVGGLVGGPNKDGGYSDTRTNTDQNEVGLDVNAGFQSAVAGLLDKHFNYSLPRDAYGCTFSLSIDVSSNNRDAIHVS